MSDYADVKQRLDAFNHWYELNGGHKSDELLDLVIADKEIERLRAALEAIYTLKGGGKTMIEARGYAKQALGGE